MALVKCTKDMKAHVQQQIDNLFKDRINKAYELQGMTDMEVADEVYNRVHTPARLKAIEEMGKDVSDRFTIMCHSHDFCFDAQPSEGIERRILVKWTKERVMIPAFSNNYHAPDVKVFSDTAKSAMINAAMRRSAVIKDREEFKSQFNKAYDQVKSINELVKLWPAVIELLPSGTMDRINKKSGPRVLNPESIDTAALSVQLLKAKVAK